MRSVLAAVEARCSPNLALVGHGHLQRVLTARWLGLDPAAGRLLRHPHPGTLSTLGYEHGQTVISTWNSP